MNEPWINKFLCRLAPRPDSLVPFRNLVVAIQTWTILCTENTCNLQVFRKMNTPRQYTRTRQYFFKKRNNRLFTNIRDGKKYERIQNNGCRIGDQMPQLAFHNRYISSRTPQNYQNRQYLYWAQLADWFSPENSAFCAGVPPEAGAGAGAGASRDAFLKGTESVCPLLGAVSSPQWGDLSQECHCSKISISKWVNLSPPLIRTSAHPKRKISAHIHHTQSK